MRKLFNGEESAEEKEPEDEENLEDDKTNNAGGI